MRTIFKVALGVIVGGAVLIVGCAAVIGVGVEEAVRETERSGVSDQAVKSLPEGATRQEVEESLGEPMDDQELDAKGREFDASCIYYQRKGDLTGMWQLCFDADGKLESRNRY
jgi:hypothetical protein